MSVEKMRVNICETYDCCRKCPEYKGDNKCVVYNIPIIMDDCKFKIMCSTDVDYDCNSFKIELEDIHPVSEIKRIWHELL